jgi:hypothetical protein
MPSPEQLSGIDSDEVVGPSFGDTSRGANDSSGVGQDTTAMNILESVISNGDPMRISVG